MRSENECSTSKEPVKVNIPDKDFERKNDSEKNKEPETSKKVVTNYGGSHSLRSDIQSVESKTGLGPVVRLPVDTKIVMRVDAGGRPSNKGTSSPTCAKKKEDLAAKIDQVGNLNNKQYQDLHRKLPQMKKCNV